MVAHLLENQERLRHIAFQTGVDQPEVIFVVEYVEVFDDGLVGDVSTREAHHLVEYREGVAHTPVGLLGDDVERFGLGGNTFLCGDILQVLGNVGRGDTLEVIDLAPRQNGGQNLVLLGGGQDEDGVVGRLFERLQKGVEGCGR